MSPLLKPVLIVAGTLSVALGVIGIFVPLLPTTPFLLLAAACYARSSQRLLHWLCTNRWFGAYISNYRAGRGIPRREKVFTLALLWLTIGVTIVFFIEHLWVRIVLVLIAAAVTVHILRIRTFAPEVADREIAEPRLNVTTDQRG